MASVNGRILVFAGAGASKAVKAEKFPTTKEFFDGLPAQITSDPLFALAMEYLVSELKSDTIDIEQILWTLQSLHNFFSEVSSPRTAVNFLFGRKYLNHLVSGQNIGNFPTLSRSAQGKLEQLISDINQIVYDLYGYEPHKKELSGNWIKLVSTLEGVGSKLDIFTTNYDGAIEVALNEVQGEITARQWRGINGTVRQTIDLGRWIDGDRSDPGLLTKLHGSLDWKFQGESIYVGDPVFTGDHTKQAIIYPGFKGESSAPFFQVFHEYLARSISDSSFLIFIGFAFRDDHINSLIRQNLRRSSQVIVINPDKSIKLPSKQVEPKYLHSGFNEQAVDYIARSIFS